MEQRVRRQGSRAVEERRGATRGKREDGVVHRVEVRPGSAAHRGQEVRPSRVRRRHELSAASSVYVAPRVRQVLLGVLQRGQGGHGQPVRPPHQRRHPETGRRLQRVARQQVAHPPAPAVPRRHAKRGGGGRAVPGHQRGYHLLAQVGPERHHQRSTVLRALRVRPVDRRAPQALAHRGQRVAVAHLHDGGGQAFEGQGHTRHVGRRGSSR
mmetsp:Transcript_10464/g.45469  ORF Transcript_10464/g.45469 Transcript_10464/m.45469 type:complete len:211 (-) Transcript_10464:320-952(-)